MEGLVDHAGQASRLRKIDAALAMRVGPVFAAARAAHPPPRMPPVNPPPAHRLSAHIKEFPIAAAHENPAKQNASDQ